MFKIETVNVHLHKGGSDAMSRAFVEALLRGAVPDDSTPPAPDASPAGIIMPPRIGQYWTGQGGVYVGMGRGFEGNPDHHLILPTDPKAIFAKRMLGTYGIDVKGATSDHDGMANTIALAEAGSDLCKEARAVEIDGHKDFYLMCRTDARLCMANVPEQFEKEWYLLSTQYSEHYAWSQLFYDGSQLYLNKKFEARARLVRRLVL